MGVARYTIFHFVKMVTGSARLFVPCRGRSKNGKFFPLLEKEIDFVRQNQLLSNPTRKRKARENPGCLLIETDLSIPPTSDTLIVSIRWTKCRANFGG